eukprot:10687101-Prorocentrum_lima.AAC.1
MTSTVKRLRLPQANGGQTAPAAMAAAAAGRDAAAPTALVEMAGGATTLEMLAGGPAPQPYRAKRFAGASTVSG